MTERLNIIFDQIPQCEIFADIGCDHGYIAQAMLQSNKANKVIVSDISQKCLLKAQNLLYKYIQDGRATSVVSNGFEKVGFCNVALIAGMGGEEICAIIESAKTLPDTLVLQPMKNPDKVRMCALSKGYGVQKDFIFKSGGKFYDLITIKKGQDFLTQEEIEFGRDNLKNRQADFVEYIKDRINRLSSYLQSQNLSLEDRQRMIDDKEKLEKYV